jgi:hypothetical protein
MIALLHMRLQATVQPRDGMIIGHSIDLMTRNGLMLRQAVGVSEEVMEALLTEADDEEEEGEEEEGEGEEEGEEECGEGKGGEETEAVMVQVEVKRFSPAQVRH